jgi:hypothetical protein
MRCASCKWAVDRTNIDCKCIWLHRKKKLLSGCNMWQVRDDCKDTLFLCDNYKVYKGDKFNICKRCLTVYRSFYGRPVIKLAGLKSSGQKGIINV